MICCFHCITSSSLFVSFFSGDPILQTLGSDCWFVELNRGAAKSVVVKTERTRKQAEEAEKEDVVVSEWKRERKGICSDCQFSS